MGKRKHYDDRSRSDTQGVSIGEALREVKRARSASQEPVLPGMAPDGQGIEDDEGWQVVASKRHRTKGDYHDEQRDGRPKVYFDPKREDKKPVRLEELRDLALYVLTDTIAPSWVAVKNRKQIRQVATLMIPGLDEQLMRRAEVLLNTTRQQESGLNRTGNEENGSIRTGDSASIQHGQDQLISNRDPGEKSLIDHEQMSWLLNERFSVRVPGDPRQSKVHSPLQAMIMKNFDDPTDVKKGRNPQERTFHPIRTPITEFIHTTDELREAEYPIHSSLFTSQLDKVLETQRREGAKQVSVDGWVDSDVNEAVPTIPATSEASPRSFVSQGLNIYAIDCEMVLTTDEKSSLARISVVSWPDGHIVLDKYVKPELPIANYFTQYSGITEKILENVTTKLSDVQSELTTLLNSSTILLGHSLESDLNAMKMTHPFIIDTSMIYPHPRGLPLRSSLKFLANKYLKREIQKGGSNGHDSVEDARAVLDLVKLKCEKGPRWGTNEANGETIFKKISRTIRHDGRAKTTAIVEYGTPERGFGKDATHAIGCQNDEEIVEGVLKCAEDNHKDQKEIPDHAVEFVWGRLRALEFARGWTTTTTNNNTQPIQNTKQGSDTTNVTTAAAARNNGNQQTPPPPPPQPITPEIDATLLTTLTNINKIRNSLPAGTLLILCSGTSDMRLVTHYQTLQNQYRKEFKVKKWDELSVRWTDDEEQALRRAVEDARMGWGWVGVV